MCKSFSSIDYRNAAEIGALLETHEWKPVSADRTPVGMISRFTCSRCGGEYVVMLTSPRAMDSFENVASRIEVSVGDISLS